MADRRRLLIVTDEQSPLGESVPAMEEFERHSCDGWDAGLSTATSQRWDVIILGYPLGEAPFEDLVDSIRAPESPCALSALVVITTPDRRRELAGYVGKGVNRVVTVEDGSDIAKTISEVIDVQPRATKRLLIQLQMPIGDRKGRILTFTENISTSGMLLGTGNELEIGQKFDFQVSLPDYDDAVTGKAEVVRHAVATRDPTAGLGIRFVSFDDDGKEALARHLERALNE